MSLVPSGPPAAAAVASAFDFTGSSDDDDDLFSRGARRTDRAAAAATTTARRRRTPAAPPAEAFDRSRRLGVRDMSSLQLSEAQRTRLQELRTDGDRHLMMFLWSQGWKSNEEGGFDLLMHQFEAVRFVAGVPRDWPSAFPISDADRQSLTASWPAGSGGGVLGDIMGLGKTVECLGGVWLRESLHGMRGLPAPLRSSLIVVPNRGVGDQWIEHAVRTGFPRADIAMFGGSKDRLRWKGKTPPRLTITTAYSIQSELRAAFSTFHKTQDGVWTYVPSVLAPHLSAAAASHLREKYHAANGQRVDRLFKDGITPADSVCDILAADLRRREIAAHPPEKPWLTCVIDEAHMLRNPSALWAMLAAAIGTHSHRLMSATGTPFNNRMQDMATLCSFYDPRICNRQNRETWWHQVFDQEAARKESIFKRRQQQSETWKKQFWLRRDHDVLLNDRRLPERSDADHGVSASADEMACYLPTETALLKALKQFQTLMLQVPRNPIHAFFLARQKRRLVELTTGLMAKVRMIVLHPILNHCSREITKLFSPSRKTLPTPECKYCVVCMPGGCAKRKSKPKVETSTDYCEEDEEDTDEDECTCDLGAWLVEGSEEEDDASAGSERHKCRFCQQAESAADEQIIDERKNLEQLRQQHCTCQPGAASLCEGCQELHKQDTFEQQRRTATRADLSRARSLADFIDGQMQPGRQQDARKDPHPDMGPLVQLCAGRCGGSCGKGTQSRHWVHAECLKVLEAGGGECPRCKLLRQFLHVGANGTACICNEVAADANGRSFEGFRPSSKLQKIQQLVKDELARKDGQEPNKIIIFSFFKGCLDLVEGMLTHELDINCERYDGDVPEVVRAKCLHRFKTDSASRVLLSTIHCGGVGLNITAASVVLFCDRWFNPQVIEQAICRAYRIGQKKPVRVHFVDALDTFDVVIKQMMHDKTQNSELVVKEQLPMAWAGQTGTSSTGYQETSHAIFRGLQRVQCQRDGEEMPHSHPQQRSHARARGRAAVDGADSSQDSDDSENEEDEVPPAPTATIIAKDKMARQTAGDKDSEDQRKTFANAFGRASNEESTEEISVDQSPLLLERFNQAASPEPVASGGESARSAGAARNVECGRFRPNDSKPAIKIAAKPALHRKGHREYVYLSDSSDDEDLLNDSFRLQPFAAASKGQQRLAFAAPRRVTYQIEPLAVERPGVSARTSIKRTQSKRGVVVASPQVRGLGHHVPIPDSSDDSDADDADSMLDSRQAALNPPTSATFDRIVRVGSSVAAKGRQKIAFAAPGELVSPALRKRNHDDVDGTVEGSAHKLLRTSSSRAHPAGQYMTVRQLKEQLAAQGVDHSLCIEKQELVDLLRQH